MNTFPTGIHDSKYFWGPKARTVTDPGGPDREGAAVPWSQAPAGPVAMNGSRPPRWVKLTPGHGRHCHSALSLTIVGYRSLTVIHQGSAQ
jgi:hypothetical protein